MAIRKIYDDTPLVNKMTQGSIINGCIAEDFPNEETYGFIITPRCDLDHEGKVNTVHYVPVVSFERWFDVIARPVIKALWKKELKDRLNKEFKDAKLGDDVMGVDFSYDDLIKICKEKVRNNNKKTNITNLLNDFFEIDSNHFNYYLLDGEDKPKNKHKMIEYISRLESDGIHAYYAIEGWKEYGKDKHLVLMLRDVRRMQFCTAMKIKRGLYESELDINDSTKNDLFFKNEAKHFFSVQSQVGSPFVEHIMQAFVYNFSRIGVEDRPGDTIDKLFNAIKSTIK